MKERRLKKLLEQRLVPETIRTGLWSRVWEVSQKRHELFRLLDLSMEETQAVLDDAGFFDLPFWVLSEDFLIRAKNHFAFVLDIQKRCVEERRIIVNNALERFGVIEKLCFIRIIVRAICAFRRSKRNAKPRLMEDIRKGKRG